MIAMFVQEFIRLCNYCRSDAFDRDFFRIMHDNYIKAWMKLSIAEQGEISYRLDLLNKKG